MSLVETFRKIRFVRLILKLARKEPNDYTLGQKIREVVGLYNSKKEINEEEILKSNTKN